MPIVLILTNNENGFEVGFTYLGEGPISMWYFNTTTSEPSSVVGSY